MKKYYVIPLGIALAITILNSDLITVNARPISEEKAISLNSSDGDYEEVENTKVNNDKESEEVEEEKKEEENKDNGDNSGTAQYTVVPGDYLIAIASRQMGDGSRWQEIVELNKDKYPSLVTNPNLIYPGWVFTLPTGSKGNTVATTYNNSSNNSNNTVTGSSNPPIVVGEAKDSSGWGSVNPLEPMATRISSPYGWRIHPISGQRKFHNGVDLPIPTGSRVNAMANGEVIGVGYDGSSGNWIRVRYDNGYETFYCHLQGNTVNKGDRVECGQQVAISDNTGGSTGPHLHMEVKVNGERVDPKTVMALP